MVKPPRIAMEETIACPCGGDEAELIPGEAMRCQACGAWIRYDTQGPTPIVKETP